MNTQYIAHRINTRKQLTEVDHQFGIELDLRDHGDRLILQHDPFMDGEDFEPLLSDYQHGTMILNIKSERIEHEVLNLIQKYQLKNYFFLDSSFPMINLLAESGEQNLALRYSEYEGLDTIFTMQGRIKWVWVDCFTQLPITKDNYLKLKEAGFTLCLVSPELQGRSQDLIPYRDHLQQQDIVFDAICTKVHNIATWQEAFP